MPNILDIKKCAEMLKCNPESLRKWIFQGQKDKHPRFFKIGNRYKFLEEDVVAWVREQLEKSDY